MKNVHSLIEFRVGDEPLLKAANQLLRPLLFLLLLSVSFGSLAQEADTGDTLGTPFKKKKWLTGLSGSISSGAARADTSSQRSYSNTYGFDLSTGRFVKDRWLVGVVFTANRQNTVEIIKREAESLFIAPFINYYFSESETGSVYLSFAPGYTAFRDETELQQAGIMQREKVEGDGFGILLRLGYSYILHERIAFDLRLNFSNSWINAKRFSEPIRLSSEDNFELGNLSFSFGFVVILDKFFF